VEHASTALEALARLLVYVPTLGLVGVVSFRWFFTARGVGLGSGPEASALLRRWGLLAAVCLVLALLLRSLAHAYAAFGEEALTWESLRLVTIESRWGGRWRWQLASGVAAVLAMALVRVAPRTGWSLATLAAPGVCASLPLTGHAMALGASALVLQAGHVAGAGIWIGTLGVAVFACGSPLARDRPDRVAETFRAFAPLAIGGALLLGLSGLVTAWLALSSWADLWGSLYGRLFLLKMGLVAAVMTTGFLNWRHFRSREPAGRGWVVRELVLATLAVAVTGWLAGTAAPS